MRVADVITVLAQIAPPYMANAGDAIGLQLGSPQNRVRGILAALDPTERTIAEAKRRRCNLLIVHHPLFRRPVPDLTDTRPETAIATAAIRAGVSILVAHTNLDTAPQGVNDVLAARVGLTETTFLTPTGLDPYRKLAVFVPATHLATVRKAVCDAGAGIIGKYSECTFTTPGTGSFRGADDSRPFLGSAGVYEEVAELRMEALLLQSQTPAVTAALRRAHPYEEPAFDIIELSGGRAFGCGRVGELPAELTVSQLAARLARDRAFAGLQILGDARQRIRTVAVWSGGSCPTDSVLGAKADVLVTGELTYRSQLHLAAHGVPAILLGHGPSEAIVLPSLVKRLRAALPTSIPCLLSTEPVLACRELPARS